jgi:hypothetical protein
MEREEKLKIWEWLFLIFIGSLFPMINIMTNSFFLITLKFQSIFYIISTVISTLIFSYVLFLTFNTYRKKTGFKKRVDSVFIFYIFSVVFGSFFFGIVEANIFVITFLVIYFEQMMRILNDFPRE